MNDDDVRVWDDDDFSGDEVHEVRDRNGSAVVAGGTGSSGAVGLSRVTDTVRIVEGGDDRAGTPETALPASGGAIGDGAGDEGSETDDEEEDSGGSGDEDSGGDAAATTTTQSGATASVKKKKKSPPIREEPTLAHDVEWPADRYATGVRLLRKAVNTRRSAYRRMCITLHKSRRDAGETTAEFAMSDYISKKDFEALHSCSGVLNLRVNGEALRLLVDNLWQRCSALSGEPVDSSTARLVKWDPTLPLSLSNIVLLKKGEPTRHSKAIQANAEKPPYPDDAMRHVAQRAKLIEQLDLVRAMPNYASPIVGWTSLEQEGLVEAPSQVAAALTQSKEEAARKRKEAAEAARVASETAKAERLAAKAKKPKLDSPPASRTSPADLELDSLFDEPAPTDPTSIVNPVFCSPDVAPTAFKIYEAAGSKSSKVAGGAKAVGGTSKSAPKGKKRRAFDDDYDDDDDDDDCADEEEIDDDYLDNEDSQEMDDFIAGEEEEEVDDEDENSGSDDSDDDLAPRPRRPPARYSTTHKKVAASLESHETLSTVLNELHAEITESTAQIFDRLQARLQHYAIFDTRHTASPTTSAHSAAKLLASAEGDGLRTLLTSAFAQLIAELPSK